MADQIEQQGQSINVLNPTGDLVSIPHDQLDEALNQHYKVASPQDISSYQKEQKYGTTGQQIISGVEGLAKGATLGAAPVIENKMLGVPYKNIKGRAETNPWISGGSEMAGLAGSSFLAPEISAAKLLGGVGEAGAGLVGLGAKEGAGALYKIGSSAARAAAETAAYQGTDELSKAMLKDPDQTASTALTNIGLSALFGGGIGAGIGAVNPLWKATVGQKVENVLKAITDRANGDTLPLSDNFKTVLENAKEHGVEVAPEIKAGLSDNPRAYEHFQALRESGTSTGEALRETLENFKSTVQDQVADVFKTEQPMTAFEAGEKAKQAMIEKAEQLHENAANKYDTLNPTNASIQIPDEPRLKFYDNLVQQGQETGSRGGPIEGLYRNYAERVLSQNTIQELDKLASEMGNDARVARREGNFDKSNALNTISDQVREFQDRQIASQSVKSGAENAEAIGNDIINQRKEARKTWAQYRENLSDMASMGKAGKARSLSEFHERLENIPSEKFASKLFDKKNSEGLKYLQKEFPEVFEALKNQQKTSMLEAASRTGELQHNKLLNSVNGLSEETKKMMFSPAELKQFQAAAETLRKISIRTNPSGTGRILDTFMKHMPGGALSAIGALFGHNPVLGYMLGQLGHYVGRDAPDAMKMGMLKFIGTDAPVDSGAFKSMIDYIHNIQKGENLIQKASKNIFKAGVDVLPTKILPDDKSREKLDKKLKDLQVNQDGLMNTGGHVGYYMPEHNAALGQIAGNAAQYLNSLRPNVDKMAPLDSQMKIDPVRQASFDQALDIAEQPLIVLENVKDGTITPQQIMHLNKIYPALYPKLVQQVSSEMMEHTSKGETIPYKMRMGLSMFMGQPLDSTMTPQAFQAMQQPSSQAQGQQPGMRAKHSIEKLGKANMMLASPDQSRQMNKNNQRA